MTAIALEDRVDTEAGRTLTVKDAAAFTGLTTRTIYEYLWTEGLPGARQVIVRGRVKQWRIPVEDLLPYLPED